MTAKQTAIEQISKDELTQLQTDRLKHTLNYVYRCSAFYTKKFNDHGVHPSDFTHLEDLAKFPFTTKEDLRNNYPFAMFAIPREKVVRIHASSGTTGKPTVVGYSQADVDMWAEVMARSIRAAGGKPGDMVHVAYGYGLFTGGLGAHYGAERLGCTVIPMSGWQTEKQVQLIRDFQPDIIMATPSYAQNIADELDRLHVDPAQLKLRVGLFGAEPWTESMRDNIEQRLGITALDLYGLSEVIGGGVAQECIETKDGPTIWEDHFYPEIIDPVSGVVQTDGTEGELVFTSLTKEAMPIIRYRTRDLTCLLPGTARVMRRMGKINGRSDDMLIIRGVNVFPSQIEEQVLAVNSLSPHYQMEVRREGNLDELKVLVELADNKMENSHDEVASELKHRIKAIVGVSAETEVGKKGTVPRSEGKAKRVVDKRNLYQAYTDSKPL